MENFTELLSYGSSILMLLCGCIFIWGAMRMEAQSKNNAKLLARVIFQETESLSNQIEKQSLKTQSMELRITREIQSLRHSIEPTKPDTAQTEHEELVDWFAWSKQNAGESQDREAA